MYYAILAFTAASSFWLGNYGDAIRVPKELACILGFLVIYTLSRHKEGVRNFWLKGFLIWGFFLTAFISKTVDSFYELFYVLSGILALSAIANADTLIPSIKLKTIQFVKILPIEEQIKGLFKIICFMSIAMATYGYLQAVGLDSVFSIKNMADKINVPYTRRLVGTLGNPTVLACWFTLTLPLFFTQSGKIKWGFWYCIPVLLLTQGRLGILSTFVALLIIAFYRNKKIFTVMFIIGTIGTTLLFTHPELKTQINPRGRFKAWKIIYNVWTKGYVNPLTDKKIRGRPLQGFGPGRFRAIIPGLTNKHQVIANVPWGEAHCEPLEIGLTYGIVGLALYLGFCGSLLWIFLLLPKRKLTVVLFACMVGFFIESLAFFPLHIGATAFLIVLYVGLFLNLQRREVYEKVNGVRDFVKRALGLCKCSRCHPL